MWTDVTVSINGTNLALKAYNVLVQGSNPPARV
jgi:hypothetical protein